jgi:hypothetical protein
VIESAAGLGLYLAQRQVDRSGQVVLAVLFSGQDIDDLSALLD